MAPKKSNQKTTKDAKTAKVAPAKQPAPNLKGWEFAPFTIKAVAFIEKADELAESLHSTYGDKVSISHYEKLIAGMPTMSSQQRDLIYIKKEHLDLLKLYRKARADRDAERDSFRGDTKIVDVDTGLEALSKLFHIEEGNDEGDDEEE